MNSISSWSPSVFGAGVGVIVVLELLCRWCLVFRRKSNDNIVDIFCSSLGECSAPTRGNTTSPKTTHRTNITVKPRNSTSKNVKSPSDSEANCERGVPRDAVLLWSYFGHSRQHKSRLLCEITRVVIVHNTCKFWHLHNQTNFYPPHTRLLQFLPRGKSGFFSVKGNSARMRAD